MSKSFCAHRINVHIPSNINTLGAPFLWRKVHSSANFGSQFVWQI